jgi:hypothetical protein
MEWFFEGFWVFPEFLVRCFRNEFVKKCKEYLNFEIFRVRISIKNISLIAFLSKFLGFFFVICIIAENGLIELKPNLILKCKIFGEM